MGGSSEGSSASLFDATHEMEEVVLDLSREPSKFKLELAIFIGGACGAVLRLALAKFLPASSHSFPWHTLIVNACGTFLLAFMATRLRHLDRKAHLHAALVMTGFCGALTTFATLQLELFQLIDAGAVGLAFAYLVTTVAVCVAAVRVAVKVAQ